MLLRHASPKPKIDATSVVVFMERGAKQVFESPRIVFNLRRALLSRPILGMGGVQGIMAMRPAPRCLITPPERSLTGGRSGRSDDCAEALRDLQSEAPHP